MKDRDWYGLFSLVVPVGSRVTMDPPPTDTDEDFCCLRNIDVEDKLVELGFKEDTSKVYLGRGGDFKSWRREQENLIVTPDIVFLNKFRMATQFTKECNFTGYMAKENRIAAHDFIFNRGYYSSFTSYILLHEKKFTRDWIKFVDEQHRANA